MRIKFSPQRAAIFSSFLGMLDIKLGAEIILLFGLINKVAGLYGLITVFVGGSFVQLLFYAYSIATMFAFLWALKVVKSETAAPTILVSHLYALDHIILSLFHYIFYRHYWYTVPHDGRRTINSQAQQDLIDLAVSRGEVQGKIDGEGAEELRKTLAGKIWQGEKGFAVWVLILGWALKVYFILVLYSYAAHLGSMTYHTLPLTSRGKATKLAHPDPTIHPATPGSSNSNNGNTLSPLSRKEESEDNLEMRKTEQQVAVANGNPVGDGTGKRKKTDEDEDLSWD
ncbi:uncharacterized protein L203_103325 [Cryptococcus depauperatus CBS 7841]|uniref:Uncharacterized protein n=1 Tax=Cryptococcus depauperatus CBS 7841 TaxID=1295531 RepID=A0A1E3I1X3_9TREE|nr:hypothetical protein L203_05358 [Cryptococcus depauperatus CBS 7841]